MTVAVLFVIYKDESAKRWRCGHFVKRVKPHSYSVINIRGVHFAECDDEHPLIVSEKENANNAGMKESANNIPQVVYSEDDAIADI